MKIIVLAVLFVLVLSLSVFAATSVPLCTDINTEAAVACPADSTVMPWDAPFVPTQVDDPNAVPMLGFVIVVLFHLVTLML